MLKPFYYENRLHTIRSMHPSLCLVDRALSLNIGDKVSIELAIS